MHSHRHANDAKRQFIELVRSHAPEVPPAFRADPYLPATKREDADPSASSLLFPLRPLRKWSRRELNPRPRIDPSARLRACSAVPFPRPTVGQQTASFEPARIDLTCVRQSSTHKPARFCDVAWSTSGRVLQETGYVIKLRSQCQLIVGSCELFRGFTR